MNDTSYTVMSVFAALCVGGFLFIVVMNTIRKAKQAKLDQERANIKADYEIDQIKKEQKNENS